MTEPAAIEAPLYRPNAGASYPGQQPGFVAMNLPGAWDVTIGDVNVFICVLDNGVALTHGDINRSANRGVNVSSGAAGGSNVATDAAGARGTTVAGIAMARYANSVGIAGVAGDCSLYSLALPNGFGNAVLQSGIDYAVTPPIVMPAGITGKVLVLPINALAADAGVTSSVADAIAANMPVVMPLGDQDAAPAAALASNSSILLAGACNGAGVRWVGAAGKGSSYNGHGVLVRSLQMPSTDLLGANGINAAAAPGGLAAFTSDYAITDGTAVAAGIVAGVAGLMLAQNAKLNPFDIQRFIEGTAQKTGGYLYAGVADATHVMAGWDAEAGYGMLDANAAVQAALKPRVAAVALPSGTVVDFLTVDYLGSVDRVIRFNYIDALGGTAPAGATDVVVTLPALPLHVTQVGGPASPFTLTAAAGFVDITLRYTAPNSTESFSGPFVPTTDDLKAPTLPLTLSYASQPPLVLDSVLVIDHSGSMFGSTSTAGKNKADAAVAAGLLYISLLHNQDNLGIVRFDDLAADPADVLLATHSGGVLSGLVSASVGAATLGARLNTTTANLEPRGSTSIGGGIELGSAVLAGQAPSVNNARALVVLTDGLQNSGDTPAMAKALLPAGVRVFAAGLGLDVGSMAQFDDIVTFSEGHAFSTGTTPGSLMDVQTLFVKILKAADQSEFAADPDLIAQPGEVQATEVNLSEIDTEADFILLYEEAPEFPKYLRVALELPDGTTFSLNDIEAGVPNIIDRQGPGHVVIRVTLPPLPASPRAANFGRYRLLVGNGTRSPDNPDGGSNDIKVAAAAGQGGVPLRYRTMVSVKSSFKLGGHLVQSAVAPGTAIEVVLEPKVYDWPVKLDTNPDVRVTRPDGAFRAVSMSRAADGSYRGTFTDTGLVGFYTFDATAVATSQAGTRMTRNKQLQAPIRLAVTVSPGGLGGEVPAGPGGNGGGGGGHGGHGGHGGSGGGGGHRPCRPLHERCCHVAARLLRCLAGALDDCCEGRKRW